MAKRSGKDLSKKSSESTGKPPKARATIDQLVINSPYEEPAEHWDYDRTTQLFNRAEGRRSAGYIIASLGSKSFDDPGVFVEIPLVNRIRSRVQAWREGGYKGATAVTRQLLEYWSDPEEFKDRRFFFCQIEAAETLIWLAESIEADRLGVDIPSSGGAFQRLCAKMATGSGKTVVMAMIIAWQILNKVASPNDNRFSKNVLVVAPGLTVKNRLAVLKPSDMENYFEAFRIVPYSMFEQLRQGQVLVHNWHVLNWESDKKLAAKRGVDKRGALSDKAYVRKVLGDIANASSLIVINDEAHHAWRVPVSNKVRGVAKSDIDEATNEATKWVGGLDRIGRALRIVNCYDFSATPFAPSGKQSSEEALFDWIVSDFGLNDAIESGLVKTPRVVIRDDVKPDTKTHKSRFYHIYNDSEVKDDLCQRANPETPLPDLVINGYYLLGYDWRETAKRWEDPPAAGMPPVMITIANRTETAARVKYAFERNHVKIPELCRPEQILHIDTKVLEAAEAAEEVVLFPSEEGTDEVGSDSSKKATNKKQRAELLRLQVNTVGQAGKEGARIQNVISVGMLSEGWDAKTVTHIMGLRAFSSQLLCEQVVGRGLRRTCYEVNSETGLFDPEYVNVFGVPFTFLPQEGVQDDKVPLPQKPKTAIEPVAEREKEYAISWPNVRRIDYGFRPSLVLDWKSLGKLVLDASQTAMLVELAPVVAGKPDTTKIKRIILEGLATEFRMQRIIFETTQTVYDQMANNWRGGKIILLGQLVRLVEKFIQSDYIIIEPAEFGRDDLKRRLVITLNMGKLVRHIWSAISCENIDTREPIFDRDHPQRSTSDMRRWYTGRPCHPTKRSPINFCVYDSTWEASDAFALDRSEHVAAWVKNDHLGFEVFYLYRGVVRRYRPDFLIRLKSGDLLILETKGVVTEQDQAKFKYLAEWVAAINEDGRFGRWSWAVSEKPGEIHDILAHHASSKLCLGKR